MSILPPTDIVMEVGHAADPQKVQLAMSRLAELSRARSYSDSHFAMVLDGAARPQLPAGAVEPPHAPRAVVQPSSAMPLNAAPAVHERNDATRKFEAFVIQSCLQTILPKEEHGLFGQGTAGGVWRSMLAEQLGNQIAKAGGIGLRKMLDQHWAQQSSQADAPQGRPINKVS